jgi:hypothetical protein
MAWVVIWLPIPEQAHAYGVCSRLVQLRGSSRWLIGLWHQLLLLLLLLLESIHLLQLQLLLLLLLLGLWLV